MDILKIFGLMSICTSIGFASCRSSDTNAAGNSDNNAITINVKGMTRIGTVDERYQSYNIEMVEVVGGRFWKPYHLMDSLPSASASSHYDISQKNDQMYRQLSPINLSDKRLMSLARGLAPAYVRVSGTWANAIYFEDNNETKIMKAPAGFVNVLTGTQWKGVLDFIKATDSKLVTSFAVSDGVRDAQGVWTPKEAQKIANYTKSQGGEIAAAELFNEPTMPLAGGEINKNYSSNHFAKDIAAFRSWSKTTVPNMLVLGPGSVLEGLPGVSMRGTGMKMLSTDSMMSAEPRPVFDVFSYHFYGAASMRMMRSGPFSIKPEKALDSSWLRRTDTVTDYYAGLRDRYNPGKPLWITETAEAAAGGDPFSATYLDCFRYVYQLGSLAKKGVKVVMHNTLAASEYSLIDQDTHLPKPNYWVALLWANLMGTEVYEAGDGSPGVYVFAHSMKGHAGGVTILVINSNKASTVFIPSDAKQYTVTSTALQGKTVQLNGRELKLDDDDQLPALQGRSIKSGNVSLPPTSISFFTMADAGMKRSE